MKINNVDFNADWAKSVNESTFVKHFLPIVWPEVNEPERKEKLSDAYKLLTGEQPAASEQPEAPKQETTKRAKTKSEPE
ncbi:MAG: hypothetical protein LBC19_12975 [Tannerella sp.]|jgi:hypothetical protein|nr:hypothetical protein [Tannerella sp.]